MCVCLCLCVCVFPYLSLFFVRKESLEWVYNVHITYYGPLSFVFLCTHIIIHDIVYQFCSESMLGAIYINY